MHYQSIVFHLCYPYDLFASHFQTYAYVLIRWSDYFGVETFLFGACNNVHCKFRSIIGLNYNLYNFFNMNTLLRTRSALQSVIRRFTYENLPSVYLALSQNCEKRLLASSVRLFARLLNRPHGITRLPLKGFSWNFTFEYFSKICRENSIITKYNKKNGYFTWRPTYIFIHLSLSSS